MKVGIEVQRIFRPKKHGMEVVALEIIKQIQLLDLKNQYTLYAKDDADRKCLSETFNFKIKTLPSKTYADWEQISLPKGIKDEDLDFLHCTCNTAPLRSNKPLLLTLHDIIYLEKLDFKGTAYQNFGNLYRRFVVPRVVDQSRFIITVSNYEKEVILEKLNLPEDKVKVVYNAVNERFKDNFTSEEKANFRIKYHLPERYLLFLGNTAPKKNTQSVIQAFSDYCESTKEIIPLVILDFDKIQVLEMLGKMGKSKFISDIIFPGYVSPDEMPLMYSSCHIFLYPSLRESFGLPILEAMGCGAPVITSNTSSMPEVAGDAAIFIDPLKSNEITEAIRLLSANESRRLELIKKGLERSSLFTWKSSAEKVLDIYSKMV